MASQKAFTTVTLRRLPQGESLQITISGNKSLSILKDKDTGTEIPAISSGNALEFEPKVYGTSGTVAALSGVVWTMDGKDVTQITGLGASIITGGILRITASPIGKGVNTTIHGIVFKFSATATLNNHTYQVEKSIVLNCAETSQNSYWGSIESDNGTTLDEDVTRTTLSPRLYLGTSAVSDFTVKWYKTGAGTGGADLEITSSNESAQHVGLSGKNLEVTRNAVDAAAHFEAHFFVGNSEVEAEGVSIVDVADTLQIERVADQYVEKDGMARFTIRAFSSKSGSTIELTNVNQVLVSASDSIRQNEYTVGTDDSAQVKKALADNLGVVTMKESNMYVPNNNTSTMAAKPWLKCGDSASADEAVASTSQATECEVTLLIGAEVDL